MAAATPEDRITSEGELRHIGDQAATGEPLNVPIDRRAEQKGPISVRRIVSGNHIRTLSAVACFAGAFLSIERGLAQTHNSATAEGEASSSTTADSAQRAIIKAGREEAERQMGRKLSLKVDNLRRKDGWAFLFSRMVGPNGDPLDPKGTRLEMAAREGVASRVFCALLKRHGS